jgi:hypothetical protein
MRVGAEPRDRVWAWDKVPLKYDQWTREHFEQAQFRAVPGAIVRRSAYIAPGVVLIPCFVNLGASVARGTIVDQDRGSGERRDLHRRGAALFGGRARRLAWETRERWCARAVALLRRDRQARGPGHAGKDQHQRIAQGLTGGPEDTTFAK